MIGRLNNLIVGRGGEQYLTVAIRADFREEYDALKDADVDVEIKKHHEKRSRNANAYCWVLLDKLAERTGTPKVDIYREAVRNIGGVSEAVCVKEEAFDELKRLWSRNGIGWQVEQMPSKIDGCVIAILIKGSSEYDTKQMARLLDNLIQDAQALGITTETPEEIEKMKSLWGGKETKQ